MESEIVITGMSGRFPESDSVAEFSDNLYSKVDLVTEDNRRWEPGLYGLPRRMGMLKDISKFDSQFFRVHHKQAHTLDPQARIMLELTYESIVDAGYNPDELRGRDIGVFIGNSFSESHDYFGLDRKKIDGYAASGCIRTMFANRVSYAFDFKGPSIVVDTACSSSAIALLEAVAAIRRGECEAAIVGGANLCLKPDTSLHFHKLNMLSDDGMCKSFDADCNGYARSEAVCALFIQRIDAARRKYASIVHIKTNTDGFKEKGVTVPSAAMQKRLFTDVYDECKLDPLKVTYVETHCTGTPAGDPIEMSAIADVFCKGRKEQLLVGSVKSNMGHPEPASGICSIIKVLISMEKGVIPPNLHYNTPHPDIYALMEGQVKVVTNPTPWEGGYAAFSSFGLGGVNVHGVLKSNYDTPQCKNIKGKTEEMIPQLVLYSSRTEEGIKTLFDYLDGNKTTREFFALLHKSAYTSLQMQPFRGYKLLTGNDTIVDITQPSTETRSLWYVFSGMGTQWSGMAKQLMHLEVFANSIRNSSKVLEPYGLNLIDLVTNDARNNISVIPAFVSIAAVQVALVDVLNELGLKPDGIVGHSAGELGCAYADGCFTADQTVLAAYWRGKVLEDLNLQEGSMAALGMTWSEASKCCPKDIYPSCHNADDSVTISGPKESVKIFVEALKAKNMFAREVDSCGYAFHSPYVFAAADKLQTALEKVIPHPKPRTSRWVSSSYSEDKWNSPECKIADASYVVHNLVSPVVFYEALKYVPKNAIVVEIAPHHLLQAILKRSIGPNAEYIGLMKKHVDNAAHLLSAIGRLYTTGLHPDIQKLYPAVQFPVPRSTPMISPLIRWDHSDTWCVAKWNKNSGQFQTVVEVNPGSEESPDHYILGHCLDGRYLYPASGYIVLAWRAFAEIKDKEIQDFPVVFENVKFHRATIISDTATSKFTVDVTNNGGEFEVSESGRIVCTGRVYTPQNGETPCVVNHVKINKKTLTLNHNDIYKELKLRGYEYGPTFQGIISADPERNHGLFKWTGNWVVFLDNILQFIILGTSKRAFYIPTRIQELSIDPIAHNKVIEDSLNEYGGIPVSHVKTNNQCFAGGVQMKSMKASFVTRQPCKQHPVIEQYQFVPYDESCILSITDKEMYSQYMGICSSVSKMIWEMSDRNKNQITDIMNGLMIDDAAIANYLKAYKDNHVLLKYLCDIVNAGINKDLIKLVKNYVNSYLSNRENDLLSQTMLSEIPLRTVIDIVFENATSRNVHIAEVSEGDTPLSSKISKYIQTLGLFKVNYSLARSNSKILNKDHLPHNAEVMSWNYKSVLNFKDIDLFVLNYLCCSEEEFRLILENAASTVNRNGFLAVLQRTHHVPAEIILSEVGEIVIPTLGEKYLEHTFKELNLSIISKKSDSLASTLYLLRKTPDATFKESIVYVSIEKYDIWIDQLKEKMLQAQNSSDPGRIWLVSEGSNHSGIVGLVNCLRQEPGGSNIRCVFTGKTNPKVPKFSLNNSFYKVLIEKNLVMNVLKKGSWGSYRHILCTKEDHTRIETEHAYLNILTPGDLSSLVWVDSPLKYFTPSEKAILCQVYYASLNFKDIMLASGKLSPDTLPGDLALQDCIIGYEYAGRTLNGQRVMGYVTHKGIATTVVADSILTWKIPDEWTLEEASTIPLAYCTAYYALISKGNLQKDEKVLIHSGSGGVGQAAIAIALSIGCEVFTSVGTSEKREFLKKRFPQLQDRHFCNSRDTSFEQHVLQQTNGVGVDVVLNSLTDDKFKASLNCLGVNSRFLEIGKYDLSQNTPLGTAVFLKSTSFHGIFMDTLFEDKCVGIRTKKQVTELLKKGIADGVVKPLNTRVFNHDQAEEAFRYMASGLHIGKVVLKIKEEEPQRTVIPTPVRLSAITRTACNPGKTYIIIGGLGGFGLELCQWFVERGAKHIVLTSRSGIKSGYQQLCIDRWRNAYEANIMVSKLNACKLDEARELLELASKHASVGGIFNLALVIRDALMENQTVQNFVEVCETKVQSTENMDVLSRKLCPDLDWFVCFSSLSCGRGSAGQSNYGYANSVMERICEERFNEGLPGLAIQWGVIGDVRAVEDTRGTDVVIGGTVPQRITSCLTMLDTLLHQNKPVVTSFVPFQPSEDTSHKLSNRCVLPTVAKIFGIKDITSIKSELCLNELGMDSLMAVELTQFLESEFEMAITTRELRKLKIKDLEKLEEKAK